MTFVPCCYFPGYYNNNNGGTNGGDTSNSPSSGGPQASSPPAQSSYGSYYQNDGAYTASPAAKAPKKKPPMHKAGKAAFPGPPGANSGSAEGYQQASSPPGQGAYNQYSQGYGQGKKSFNQSQGGAGGYSYSTYTSNNKKNIVWKILNVLESTITKVSQL